MPTHPRITLRNALHRGARLFATLLCATAIVASAQPAGTWKTDKLGDTGRTLTYEATVPLLGKPTKINVVFQCDPISKGDVHGTVGFDLYLHKVAALKPFSFDDFEGPDAVAGDKGRKPMALIVKRKGKPPLRMDIVPNGFTPHMSNYAFGIAAMSKEPKSEAKTLLRALEADDAESLQIIITDTRKPSLKLDLTVPVAGRQADFKALLTGLK
ncbi:MAG: hypothetical protein JNM76_07510 [Betaproteobacteria bacterium]|nr:hypothetical protein [Betaproteobacteria bacterium]